MISRSGRESGLLRAVLGAVLAVALGACATVPWPDEPGIPVAASRIADVEAEEAFLAALTAERRVASLPAPVVTPRYQSEIRAFADDLRSGKISALGARSAIAEWGRAAYKRPVDAWLVACGAPGGHAELPRPLVAAPAAVISFAAAHFHPRSLPAEQCAILVVLLEGSESVVQEKL